MLAVHALILSLLSILQVTVTVALPHTSWFLISVHLEEKGYSFIRPFTMAPIIHFRSAMLCSVRLQLLP